MPLTLYRNPINRTRYEELNQTERYAVALALDQEYRGDGIHADSFNISDKIVNAINKERLERMALYINVYRRIIDTEANSYSQRGFQRHFTNVTKAENARLIELYKELNADTAFIEFERQASYLGTVLVTITNDPITGQLRFVKLTPVTKSLVVTQDDYFPAEIKQIEYQTKIGDKDITNIWDAGQFLMEHRQQNDKVTYLEGSGSHAFHKPPFAILRYVTDSSRFWGPLDFGAYSFFQTRSLLLSDSILRSQTSLFDMLVFSGYTPDEAIQAVKKVVAGKVLINPEAKAGPDGATVQPDVKFISPSMLEPEKIWSLYESLYTHFLQSRGMTPRNFEVGSDPQSADAQRISDRYILSLQQSRKRYLQRFEQDLFQLIVWRNNNYTDGIKIPEKATLITDFQDPMVFSSTNEKIAYFEYMVRQNILTPVDIMRIENPDLNAVQALRLYDAKKAFNEANNSNTEQPKGTEQLIDVGDEGNPYKRKFEGGKYYWTWGNQLKWYVGSKDSPPAKLRNQVKAIQAN
jgi:hypothetical protein